MLVVLAFSSAKIVPWQLRNRWDSCLLMISNMNFYVSHIYREGNHCADKMGLKYHHFLKGFIFQVSSSSSFQAPFLTIPGYPFLIVMAVKPTVAFRAILVGGIAAFAKIAGAMKAAGGVKMGAAAAAMTAAATAAMTGSKQEQTDASQQPSK
ncbi:hypothetical protein QL285_042140 [Trifolium repens]|nr:hypothetical protein QL285_042140 [Trifolium repens]